MEKYGLDLHCTMMLEEFRELMPTLKRMQGVVSDILKENISKSGIYITALETRIKGEESLAGKLELKGSKYSSIYDLTDLLGARVITFYTDEVDKVSALVDRIFDIDWQNSVDKRKMHELDSFGYNSLHFICRIPESLFRDDEFPQLNTIRFEIQIRTALQHVWATMHHDTGYKSGVEIPREYLRNLNRLAGMLELADEQFSTIRTAINDYRRQVRALVSDGRFDEVPLNGDTLHSYLELMPFDKLNKKIAAINQAEIHQSSIIPYLEALKSLGFKTLGDLQNLIKEYSDDAYQLAVFQLGNTDIDIINSTLAIENLLEVYIMLHGGGADGLTGLFDMINGGSPYNRERAERILSQAQQLSFMNR